MNLSTSKDLSKSSARDFIFKLFVLDKDVSQRKDENIDIAADAASVEYRRVRFSTLAGPERDKISVEGFLLANSARSPETTYLTCSTARNRSDCYQSLLDRSKLYFAPSSVDKNAKIHRNRLLYQDDDDDWVVLGSKEELADAMIDVLNKNSYSLTVGVQSLCVPQEEGEEEEEVAERCPISRYTLKEAICHSSSKRSTRSKKQWKVVLEIILATCVSFACTVILWTAIEAYFSAKEYHERPVVDAVDFSDLTSMLASLSENENIGTGTQTSVHSNSTRYGPANCSNACSPELSSCYDGLPLQKVFSDILEEVDTPHSHYLQKAYKWMAKDPHYHHYSRERLQQRLGLVAFFYATEGDTSWKRSDDWLSYSIHECSWFPGGHSVSLCNKDWQYERLWLPDNGLNGNIPTEALSLLPSLTTIRLDRNIWLTGTLPSEIGDLTRLEQLWLHHNMLSGSLPSELARLTRLEKLCLAANTFTGRLAPETFGSLTFLRKLWLDHNEFTGRLPSELGNLPLVKLHISHNPFDGGGLLPSSLASLTELEHLVASVSADELDVVVPTEIGTMTNLRHLHLYVPEEIWSSLSSHQWQRSEVAALHKLDTLRIASEESGAEPVDLITW